MASDLAREIIAQTQLHDRSSPLVLVVYSRSLSGRILRNELETMRITAPVHQGRIVIRISFPIPNFTATAVQTQRDGDGHNPSRQQAVLDYDATTCLEGTASCVVGYMTHRDHRDIMMFFLESEGKLGQFPLARWSLDDNSSPGAGITSYKIQITQQILRAILVL
mmetsp:Transcript_17949/g.37530  ORF Transcript_17949/g.37530 Transcript_17949/m.37530 type:complete len:165 (+) Transcript_17949:44-538(+)|eukprot:CAMPEP_0171354200 /NCGR_PEP_ID=MMETSP0878-20121228/44584_1 /TAXON_ID=67004 /ORGANISM="Thalassiosira weissflogii, Strain CCMP1336" /LENGTH=164 /DNA_ID=CAMNT_0011860165 /DNA_START=42 /DNA_END=536 /DNA_ORIENTATION=-